MTDGEKLQALQHMTGLSWRELAEKVGIASAQTFTDIRSGRHGISLKLANKIISAFPQVRREWLMFESGPMTIDEPAGVVALYNNVEELSGSVLSGLSSEAINVGSCFPKAELAIRNTSESMTEYPVGSILILKRVMDVKLLIPGNNYLVETNEFSVVKRLQKGKDDNYIALYSTNDAKYPDGRLVYEPFEIPMDSVNRVFNVLGYIYTQSSDIGKV